MSFEVASSARLWSSVGILQLWRGWLFDLRISDVRESVLMADPGVYQGNLADVGIVHTHLILPPSFESLPSHPPSKYTRALEGRHWEDYLGSATHLLFKDRSRMLVHSWQSPSDASVSETQPYRCYARFRRSSVAAWLLAVAGLILGAVVVNLLTINPDLVRQSQLRDLWDDAFGWARNQVHVLTGLSIVASLAAIGALFKRVRRWMAKLGSAFRFLEKFVYSHAK
jgi:hypothetical protein